MSRMGVSDGGEGAGGRKGIFLEDSSSAADDTTFFQRTRVQVPGAGGGAGGGGRGNASEAVGGGLGGGNVGVDVGARSGVRAAVPRGFQEGSAGSESGGIFSRMGGKGSGAAAGTGTVAGGGGGGERRKDDSSSVAVAPAREAAGKHALAPPEDQEQARRRASETSGTRRWVLLGKIVSGPFLANDGMMTWYSVMCRDGSKEDSKSPARTRNPSEASKVNQLAPIFGGRAWGTPALPETSKATLSRNPNPPPTHRSESNEAGPEEGAGDRRRGRGSQGRLKGMAAQGADTADESLSGGRNTGGNTEWNKMNLASIHLDEKKGGGGEGISSERPLKAGSKKVTVREGTGNESRGEGVTVGVGSVSSRMGTSSEGPSSKQARSSVLPILRSASRTAQSQGQEGVGGQGGVGADSGAPSSDSGATSGKGYLAAAAAALRGGRKKEGGTEGAAMSVGKGRGVRFAAKLAEEEQL